MCQGLLLVAGSQLLKLANEVKIAASDSLTMNFKRQLVTIIIEEVVDWDRKIRIVSSPEVKSPLNRKKEKIT